MSHDSPFSFHCMICFEEFDTENRYPVVLPCGHTYVCKDCSERIDKCMECRTPVYMTMPQQQQTPIVSPTATLTRSSWANNRREATNGTQPPKPVKKRLPLPKNVVLLSLIEATALASEKVQPRPPAEEPLQAIRTMGSMMDQTDEDEDEDEAEKIKIGTSLAVGKAGTYAVAAREGLEIFANLPHLQKRDEEDVDNLMRNLEIKNSVDSREQVSPLKLSHGDRVQIVSLEEGWAKLARGYGYVRAEGHHLVKVGNSLDRACKIEAILRTLSARKRQLRIEQTAIDNQFIRMLNSLQVSLQKDEDLTVIVADAFSSVSDEELTATSIDDNSSSKLNAVASKEMDEIDRQKARNAESQALEQPQPSQMFGRLGCFAGSMFDMDDVDQPTLPAPTSTFLQALNEEVDNLMPSTAYPSHSAMRAGAQAWRDRNRQEARNGINFRTGMSGHMGVSNSRHPHEYLDPETRQDSFAPKLRMSSHLGLSTSNARKHAGMFGSLTPTLRSHNHDEVEHLTQSESM